MSETDYLKAENQRLRWEVRNLKRRLDVSRQEERTLAERIAEYETEQERADEANGECPMCDGTGWMDHQKRLRCLRCFGRGAP